MKDFCKWLGVNEKIAKIVVWIFLFLVSLIIINTALESLGLSYYKLTMENLSKLKLNNLIATLLSWITVLLSYYAFIFLVFRIKNFKNIAKYSIIYLFLNVLLTILTNKLIVNIFIILYVITFCFLYSKKNWRYLFYGLGSVVYNMCVQYICYLYKARFLDFGNINYLNQFLTSFDYFIIIGLTIFIKEIMLKKKGVK